MATHETANDPLDPSVLRAAAGRLRHCGADPGRDAHPRAGGGGHADADARPAEHGQLYAAAYLGYQAPTDLDFFQQTYFGGRELPVHHISDGDFYLIIPRDPNATVRLYKNDMVTDSKTLFYEQTNGDAFVIGFNVSDIFPDVTVSITSGGETVDFSPYISLKDGSVQVGARGLNITRISTSS